MCVIPQIHPDSAKRLNRFNPRNQLTHMNSGKPVSERYYIAWQRQKLPPKRGFFGFKKKISQYQKAYFQRKKVRLILL